MCEQSSRAQLHSSMMVLIFSSVQQVMTGSRQSWRLRPDLLKVRTRMPYVQECRHGATQGVLRPRGTGGVELEVHGILSATVRAEEVNAHLHAHTENTGAGKSVESEDVAEDDDEEQRDQV